MADLWRPKGEQFFDSSGDPLAGGKLRYYDAGTTSARAVYQDSTPLTTWTQPITLDSAGRLTASIYIPTGAFKETLTDADGTQIYSEDNIPGAITIPDADYARPETPIITKAGNYTVLAADLGSLFVCDATGGSFTLTLISAITAGDGATVNVVQIGSGGKVTIATSASQTINGLSSIALTAQYSGVTLVSDGANWNAIESDAPHTVLSKTAHYTVQMADQGRVVLADATSAAITITLPAAATAGAGFTVAVKKTDSSANAVTLDGNASETIDGSTTLALSHQYETVIIRCDATGWYVMGADGRTPTTTRGDLIYRNATVNARLAIGTDNKVLSSDGTDPGWETITSLLDSAFSSTQGVVLYRGASAWAALAVGTAGHHLKTGGAAANPSWVVPTVVKSATPVSVAATGSTTAPTGTTFFDGSDSTAPTTSQRRIIDTGTAVSFAATYSNSRLEIHYRGYAVMTSVNVGAVSASNIGDDRCVALFVDSDANALDWVKIGSTGTDSRMIDVVFRHTVSDTSSHTYRVAVLSWLQENGAADSAKDVSTLSRRSLGITEFSA